MKTRFTEEACAISKKYNISYMDAIGLSHYVFDKSMWWKNSKTSYEKVMDSKFEFRKQYILFKIHRFWMYLYEDSWIEMLHYAVCRKYNHYITDPKFRIKIRKQRAKRGFSDEDSYSINTWLTTVLPSAIEHMAENLNGFPTEVEALMEGKDPRTFEYKMEETIDEKKSDEMFDWWKSYLFKIAHHLREANEDTCSMKNEIEYESKFKIVPSEDDPYIKQMVSDRTQEDEDNFKKYVDRETEISHYMHDNFKTAMSMISTAFPFLCD